MRGTLEIWSALVSQWAENKSQRTPSFSHRSQFTAWGGSAGGGTSGSSSSMVWKCRTCVSTSRSWGIDTRTLRNLHHQGPTDKQGGLRDKTLCYMKVKLPVMESLQRFSQSKVFDAAWTSHDVLPSEVLALWDVLLQREQLGILTRSLWVSFLADLVSAGFLSAKEQKVLATAAALLILIWVEHSVIFMMLDVPLNLPAMTSGGSTSAVKGLKVPPLFGIKPRHWKRIQVAERCWAFWLD